MLRVCGAADAPYPPPFAALPLQPQDGGETDDAVVIVTEAAVPLTAWLAAHRSSPDFGPACVWGLFSLVTALAFVNGDCKLVHGSLSTDSVWVTRGGNWTLGGFELTSEAGGEGGGPDRFLMDNDGGGPCPDVYKAPERAAREWGMLSGAPRSALDAYALGVLLLEVFLGPARSPTDVKAAVAAASPAQAALPVPLRALFARLLAAAPRSRPTPEDVLRSEHFKQPLVGCLLFLDELALKEPSE
jgi:SCY1-like protein 1